jgi:hypothetical protein
MAAAHPAAEEIIFDAVSRDELHGMQESRQVAERARIAYCGVIVIGIFATATSPSADEPPKAAGPSQKTLHYFRSSGGAELIVSVAKSLCGELTGGRVERSFQVKCENRKCSVNYEMQANYFDKSVYVTPSFDVLFQDDPKIQEPAPEEEPVPLILGPLDRISVRVTTKLSPQSEEIAAGQSECFRAIGDKLLNEPCGRHSHLVGGRVEIFHVGRVDPGLVSGLLG